jgi:hypothetical protein
MTKLYALVSDPSVLAGYRAHWLKDHSTGQYYAIIYARDVAEVLKLEAASGVMLLPHIEDQMTTLSQEIVEKLPAEAGVAVSDNTFKAMRKLHKHFGWPPMHPLHS